MARYSIIFKLYYLVYAVIYFLRLKNIIIIIIFISEPEKNLKVHVSALYRTKEHINIKIALKQKIKDIKRMLNYVMTQCSIVFFILNLLRSG